MILKLKKLQQLEEYAKALILNEIRLILVNERRYRKYGDEDYKLHFESSGFDIALDILEIKIDDLRGDLCDLLHDVVLNKGNSKKKPENILTLFYGELVSYVEKYIKADKAYS